MKSKKMRRRSFLKQVMALSLSACIASMMILAIVQTFLSVCHFSRQAREDLTFYLESTNERFDTRIKNMENIVVTFRNNSVIRKFLSGAGYDLGEVKREFELVTNLYSEHNMVDSAHPFIGCIYLFNKNGKWVSSQVYPQTVEEDTIQELTFKELHGYFEDHQNEYRYVNTPDRSFICTRVYDDQMRDTGTCIMTIEREAVEALYEKSERFPDKIWNVVGSGQKLLFQNKNSEALDEDVLSGLQQGSATVRIGRVNYLVNTQKTGFGMQSRIMVDRWNIYRISLSMIRPFTVVFVVVIGAAAIVVLIVATRITRPIKQMSQDMQQIGRGNLSGRMRRFDAEEFDEVSRLYNQMTEEIQNLITEVYEKQLLASQAHIKYLQSQINPHFMFNILSMMSMRAGLKGDKDMQRLLSAFAKLMQGKIFRKGEILIPLYKELELAEFYLMLQSERFGGKITYQIECDPLARDVLIPRLTVEPLVENAVSHGLEPKPEKGNVTVTVKMQADELHIQVSDNGVGFSLTELADKERQMADETHTHIGIENTRQMLRNIYGSRASMEIQSEVGAGTTVTMVLPIEIEGRDRDVEGNDCGR